MGNYHVPFCRAVEGATPSLTLIISSVAVTINSPGGSGALSCSLQDYVLRATENVTLSRQAG